VPTYDYECEACHRTFEARQRISESPLTRCKFCGGPVHRLLAATPFILKGGGWYVTDYPSEARKKAIESEKKATEPAPAAASTASSGSGESTPATPASAPTPASSTSTPTKSTPTTS
jgi:putative FmdB family regulatory protein